MGRVLYEMGRREMGRREMGRRDRMRGGTIYWACTPST
jgi:hypothetical protein